ncbi:MAG: ABC transporter permease [Rhodospirillales bacterium]|nr:ABC transporter permease [Rhodospirillales bacterium]
MNATLTIAGKEFRQALRNQWVLAMTVLLAVLALSLALLGSAPTGSVGVDRLSVTVVSLASLSIFLLPLISLMLSYDAVVGEIERGTLLLILAYPVSRWQMLLGKFIGHLGVLAIATAVGYGISGLVVGLTFDGIGATGWRDFGILIATSVLLGAAFIAIGYLLSVVVAERATAAGLAVGVWLIFVLVFDLVLLGVLVMDHGQRIGAELLNLLFLLNPADVFRIFNLPGASGASLVSGMGTLGTEGGFDGSVLIAAMLAWIALPLFGAGLLFGRREL